jgi:hypothetical protein
LHPRYPQGTLASFGYALTRFACLVEIENPSQNRAASTKGGGKPRPKNNIESLSRQKSPEALYSKAFRDFMVRTAFLTAGKSHAHRPDRRALRTTFHSKAKALSYLSPRRRM